MKKGINRKALILPLFILAILAINLVLVSAETPVEQGTWYGDTINFLKLGDTWEYVFITIFLMLIVASATYDVLSLTMFRSPAVKVIIGIGLAGIVSVLGILRSINAWLFALAGEVTVVAIVIAIGAGAIAFMLVHLGISSIATRIEKASGEVEAARAYTEGKKAGARERGYTEGGTGHSV